MNATRNPDQTRQALLEAGFHEIHENGFRATSLDRILAQTGVTKGALYHHFPNKLALGYAVVDEIVAPWIAQHWESALDGSDDPIGALQQVVLAQYESAEDCLVENGCPLNNLIQEMAGVDEGFRRRLQDILERWRAVVEAALVRGRELGVARPELDARRAAHFIVASIEGIAGAAKSAGRREAARPAVDGLIDYLDSLRNQSKERVS